MDISSQPSLRLVIPEMGPTIAQSRARRSIENENLRAARLAYECDHDVRRILAIKTGLALEGGRAAILAPQLRRDLVQQGAKLGLRPFESNLIIAVVQDGARRGEPVAAKDVQRSLEVIPSPAKPDTWNDPWTWARLWLAAAALGGLMMLVLVEWLGAL